MSTDIICCYGCRSVCVCVFMVRCVQMKTRYVIYALNCLTALVKAALSSSACRERPHPDIHELQDVEEQDIGTVHGCSSPTWILHCTFYSLSPILMNNAGVLSCSNKQLNMLLHDFASFWLNTRYTWCTEQSIGASGSKESQSHLVSRLFARCLPHLLFVQLASKAENHQTANVNGSKTPTPQHEYSELKKESWPSVISFLLQCDFWKPDDVPTLAMCPCQVDSHSCLYLWETVCSAKKSEEHRRSYAGSAKATLQYVLFSVALATLAVTNIWSSSCLVTVDQIYILCLIWPVMCATRMLPLSLRLPVTSSEHKKTPFISHLTCCRLTPGRVLVPCLGCELPIRIPHCSEVYFRADKEAPDFPTPPQKLNEGRFYSWLRCYINFPSVTGRRLVPLGCGCVGNKVYWSR